MAPFRLKKAKQRLTAILARKIEASPDHAATSTTTSRAESDSAPVSDASGDGEQSCVTDTSAHTVCTTSSGERTHLAEQENSEGENLSNHGNSPSQRPVRVLPTFNVLPPAVLRNKTDTMSASGAKPPHRKLPTPPKPPPPSIKYKPTVLAATQGVTKNTAVESGSPGARTQEISGAAGGSQENSPRVSTVRPSIAPKPPILAPKPVASALTNGNSPSTQSVIKPVTPATSSDQKHEKAVTPTSKTPLNACSGKGDTCSSGVKERRWPPIPETPKSANVQENDMTPMHHHIDGIKSKTPTSSKNVLPVAKKPVTNSSDIKHSGSSVTKKLPTVPYGSPGSPGRRKKLPAVPTATGDSSHKATDPEEKSPSICRTSPPRGRLGSVTHSFTTEDLDICRSKFMKFAKVKQFVKWSLYFNPPPPPSKVQYNLHKNDKEQV